MEVMRLKSSAAEEFSTTEDAEVTERVGGTRGD